jgi:hypothetical protein
MEFAGSAQGAGFAVLAPSVGWLVARAFSLSPE